MAQYLVDAITHVLIGISLFTVELSFLVHVFFSPRMRGMRSTLLRNMVYFGELFIPRLR